MLGIFCEHIVYKTVNPHGSTEYKKILTIQFVCSTMINFINFREITNTIMLLIKLSCVSLSLSTNFAAK